jgi:hypothetical protein
VTRQLYASDGIGVARRYLRINTRSYIMRAKKNGQAAFTYTEVEIDARAMRLAMQPRIKHIRSRQDELDFAEESIKHKVVPVFHTHCRIAKRLY